ncbi:MAG: asparagine synthase (glutamine-hydrolyzing) [Pseudomonadota bacterium]
MCGIAGISGPDAASRWGQPVVKAMTDAIVHRGPDGEGFLAKGDVVLGHRRLSIIDLEGGDQPIFNEDRSIAIVFNGEIYNYKELREDLVKRGYQFATHSDTETIVHLYQEYGVAAVEHMIGMFAFALWDDNKQRLFIARDRLGEKPLYYSMDKGNIAFASELKALAPTPWLSADIDAQSVADYLALGYVPSPKTILAGAQKLPPAHCLVWEAGQARLHRYWEVEYDQPRRTAPESEIVDEFESLLRSAIKMQLRSDVPVASFLSGGIDSSLISALAAEEYSGVLKTFTVGFNEQAFDESGDAQRVADYLKTDHHTFIVEDDQLAMLPELVQHYDEPFADPSMLPTHFVTRAASEQVKVCLSGDAGDELFGGYRRYLPPRSERIGDAIPGALRRTVSGLLAGRVPMHWKGAGLLDRLSVDGAARYLRSIGVFGETERMALFRAEHDSVVQPDEHYFSDHWNEQGAAYERKMYTDLHHYLTDDILVKVDRAAMKNSLEVRVPLLDHRIVEFAATVPNTLRINDGSQKVMLRKLLQRLLPEWVLNKPKQGFGLPIGSWFRGSASADILEPLLRSDARCNAFFDQRYVHTLVSEHQKGQRDLSARIWSLLCLEMWLESWRETHIPHRG